MTLTWRLGSVVPQLPFKRRAVNTTLVTRPEPAEGWTLEATNALPMAPASWPVIPPSYETNGTNLQFIEPAPVGNKFYRLHKP